MGGEATTEGYGVTIKGTAGDLLESNVTVISNEECTEILNYNATRRNPIKRRLEEALPLGITPGILCSQGTPVGEVFSGTCRGDSGGPLKIKNSGDRDTLIGIISGGAGCGQNFPNWFTKVSFYYFI